MSDAAEKSARLIDDAIAFRALCEQCSDATGVPLEIVEKDYWATRALHAATTAPNAELVVFKGGTSLSKALGLIERYSEDIDLIVLFGAALGSNAVKRAFREVADHVAHTVGCAWVSEHESRGALNARYAYPTPNPEMSLFESGVLLEMGNRGGPHPTEIHAVSSMVGDHVAIELPDRQFADLAAFEVNVLAPERTLTEKLDALHSAAMRGTRQGDAGSTSSVRHRPTSRQRGGPRPSGRGRGR